MAKSLLVGPGAKSLLQVGTTGILLSDEVLISAPILLTANPAFTPGSAGQVIAELSPPSDGATRTFTPNDGRLALATGGTQMTQGLSAAAPGTTIDVVVTDTLAGAANSPQSVSFSISVRSPIVISAATYDPSMWRAPTPGAPLSGMVMAPSLLPLSGSDIVAFNIQIPPDSTLGQRYDSMGHFFRQGQVQPSDWIEVFYSGSAKPVQMDVLKRWSDGSVKFAGLSFLYPGGNAGDVIQAKFRKAGTSPGGPLPVNNNPAPSFTANLNTLGSNWDVGVGTMLGNHKVAGTWFSGPICRAERAERYIGQAVRVVMDCYRYTDGSCKIRWQFLADVQLWSGGGNNWNFDASIARSGTSLFAYNGVTYQGTGFTKVVHTANSDAYNQRSDTAEHNIQFDPSYLIHAGGLPLQYQLEYGISQAKIDEITAVQSGAGWRRPHQVNGVHVNRMADVSDARQDLGTLNGWAVSYFLTGNYKTRRACLGVAEAVLSLPVNTWVIATKTPLNVSEDLGHPNIWVDVDGRDGGGNPVNLRRNANAGELGGRDYELAHQPCLGYPAFLATAERYYWDMTHQQAQISQTMSWNALRWKPVGGVWKPWSMVTDYQVRGSGWRQRDWCLAQHICPESDPLHSFYAQYTKWNMDYLREALPAIKAKQGSSYGWSTWMAADYIQEIKFWMEDHYFQGLYCAWLAGEPLAKEVALSFHAHMLRWRDGTDIGRGLAQGSSYQHTTGYNLQESNLNNLQHKTPYDILGLGDNFYGWGNGQQLWLKSLVLLYTMTGDSSILTTVSRIYVSGDGAFVGVRANQEDFRHMTRPMQKA